MNKYIEFSEEEFNSIVILNAIHLRSLEEMPSPLILLRTEERIWM